MNWITWALLAIGSLGLGGIIALAILAPATLLIVWQVIAKLFFKVIETRVGVGALVAVAVWFVASFYQQHVDNEKFEQQKAEFKAAQLKRDADIARDTKLEVEKRLADLYMWEQESDHDVATFKKALPADPTGCRRVGAAAGWLSALGNGRRLESGNNKRMQPVGKKAARTRGH